ncbi:aminotransferase class I/II-fold pyridoxal phosphate-dependent enzyme [Lactobacillus sp. R2/2]|nr:aminotransferase class I/II-fold pyridoxal phosphate-dependent enzyme [Lactobacillus sp. R2/2]
MIDDHVYSDYPCKYQYQPISTDISHQILVSSFSKSFAIPGIRLGYVIASANIIERDGFYNEGITFSAPTISQFIGEIILEEPEKYTHHIAEIKQTGAELTRLLLRVSIFLAPHTWVAYTCLLKYQRLSKTLTYTINYWKNTFM